MTEVFPRRGLDYFDANTLKGPFECFRGHISELLALIESEPTKLPQVRHSSLASDYTTVALYAYGLGYPLAIVIENFRLAVPAYLKMFRRRGTERPFEVYVVEPSQEELASPESAFRMRLLHGSHERDFSLTNSHKNYYATCLALVVGDYVSASELAGMIWDPPDATYIGPNSFCTLDDQRLAYGLKALFEGRSADMDKELKWISQRSTAIVSQAEMLRAIQAEDSSKFLQNLDELLIWHENEARSKKNGKEPDFFLCITALGLIRLALRNGVCSLENIPGSKSIFAH